MSSSPKVVICEREADGCCSRGGGAAPESLLRLAADSLVRAAMSGAVLRDEIQAEVERGRQRVYITSEYSQQALGRVLSNLRSKEELKQVSRTTMRDVYYFDLYVSQRAREDGPAVGISGKWGVLRYGGNTEIGDESRSFGDFCAFKKGQEFMLGFERLAVTN
jgi:hypothetical protein